MNSSSRTQPEITTLLTLASLGMVPIVTLCSYFVGNGVIVAPGIALAFAAAALLQMWRPGPYDKPIIGVALIGQAIALTASLAGHPWQIDSHMVFFAFLATLVALMDVRTIVVATLAVALHHLGFVLALPALVYPSTDILIGIERTAFHAVVILIEAGTLVLTIRRLQRLGSENEQQMREIDAATKAAETARDTALAAKAEADRQRHDAERSRADAERALRDLEEKQRREIAADAEAKARDAAARQAEEERKRQQQYVFETLGHGLKALAGGDLTSRISEPFAQEYEELRANFNTTASALAQAIGEVADHAVGMVGESTQISQTTSELSSRAERQAHQLAETATAMKKVTELVKTTADGAAEAAKSAVDVRTSAEDSGKIVARASAAMSGIDESAGEINTIIDVIDQIAFQTNLLALNAGVEAARAGEAGRGFAVVASEVRALAQRSSEAAKDISDLIAKSQSQVKDGVRLVGETVQALEGVSVAVSEISERVEKISRSATEQATALIDISASVSDIDAVTQQNTAMLEETAAAAGLLTGAASTLRQLTDGFRHDASQKQVTRATATKAA